MEEIKEVSHEEIEAWKEKYGSVYCVRFDNLPIYFRSINRDDYIELSQKQVAGEPDFEKAAVEKCILNTLPEGVLFKKAGLSTVIYEQLMLKSGFIAVEAEEL